MYAPPPPPTREGHAKHRLGTPAAMHSIRSRCLPRLGDCGAAVDGLEDVARPLHACRDERLAGSQATAAAATGTARRSNAHVSTCIMLACACKLFWAGLACGAGAGGRAVRMDDKPAGRVDCMKKDVNKRLFPPVGADGHGEDGQTKGQCRGKPRHHPQMICKFHPGRPLLPQCSAAQRSAGICSQGSGRAMAAAGGRSLWAGSRRPAALGSAISVRNIPT